MRPRFANLNDEEREAINDSCESFEKAIRGEDPISIENQLAATSEQVHDNLFPELLAIELDHQSGASDPAGLSGYLTRFPDREDQIRAVYQSFSETPTTDTPTIDTPTTDVSATERPTAALDVTVASSDQPTRHSVVASPRPSIRQLGDYELLDEIARGGMGVVYRARQIKANRIVALKMILSGNLATEADIQRFKVEAGAAANLEHPNIVRIYDVGEHEGQHYYSMSYVEGESLSVRLKEGPLEPRESARLIRDVASGVDYAHQHGTVHRDLKPANILIDSAGNPKITDFGLAKNQLDDSGLTVTGQILGTPSYMPPEQAKGDITEIGPLADVYALGATLYQTLTGHPPFLAASMVETVQQVLGQEPVPPRQLNRSIDVDLETICLKCLQKDQSARYTSAGDLVADLDHWLAGEPIIARPVGPLRRGWRWCKRNKLVATLSTAVALALIIGSCFSTWFAVQANRRADDAALASLRADAEAETAREESRAARTNLYRSRLREAEAIRLARRPGYRVLANDLLRSAAAIDTPDRDEFALRQEAVASMGDFVGLQPLAIDGLPASITDIAVSVELGRIAIGMFGGAVSIRDIATGAETASLRGGSRRMWVGFKPDTSQLITVSTAGRGIVWEQFETDQWRQVSAFTTPPLSWTHAFDMDADRNRFAACSGNRVLFVSLDDPTSRTTYQVPGRVNCVALSADGSRMAAGAFLDQGKFSCTIWDTETEEVIATFAPEFETKIDLKFSRDGKLLSCSGREGVAVYETETFTRIGFRRGHMCHSTDFSVDQQSLALVSQQEDSVFVWKHSVNHDVAVLKIPNSPLRVVFTDDAKKLICSSDRSVRVWNLMTPENRHLTAHRGGVPGAVFNAEASKLYSISKDQSVKVFDLTSGEVENSLPLSDLGQCIALHPNGRHLAVGGYTRGIAEIWDLQSSKKIQRVDHKFGAKVHSVEFSRDGKLLAFGGVPGLGVWHVEVAADDDTTERIGGLTLTPVEKGPPPDADVGDLLFSPDGKLIVWTSDLGDIHIWDLASGEERTSPDRVLARIESLAFFPDSRRLAYLNQQRNVEIWDIEQSKILSQFPIPEPKHSGDTSYSAKIRISPSGKLLAITSISGRGVNLWDPATGELLLVFPARTGTIWSLPWSADGNSLAITRSNGDLTVWRIDEVKRQLAELELGL